MTESDIKAGLTFRAKRPVKNWLGEFNDRTVIWRGAQTLQYDGPSVRLGSKYPRISVEKFLAWAGSVVTQ